MISFGSDNHAPVHPLILEEIKNVNIDFSIAYGDDIYTEKAIQLFRNEFGENSDIYFVLNGTGANVSALKTFAHSYNAIISCSTAHIEVDECGAPENSIGAKIFTHYASDGKLTVEMIEKSLHNIGFQHHAQPSIISISQSTELGTVYTPEEIKKLTDFAHKNKLYVHLDGARISNAAAFLNKSFREFTFNVGVDVISFGGTKNGLMIGEAVVFANKELSTNFKYIRKQNMQLASKMRYISAQFIAMFKDNLWLKNASHANRMALLLKSQLEKYKFIQITQKVEANAIFAIIPKSLLDELMNEFFFYTWDEERNEVRWMTSFATKEEDVMMFVSSIERIAKKLSLL